MNHAVPLIAAAALLLVASTVQAQKVYPERDHYVSLPTDWYSYDSFRIGSYYTYVDQGQTDNEADGVAPALDFTTSLGQTNAYVAGGAFWTRLKDVDRKDYDYLNAYLGLGYHIPITPRFDFALEVGPGVTRQAEHGIFGGEEETKAVFYGRATSYTKLSHAIDLRLAAGMLGDPVADASIDFRLSRTFSLAPTVIYRHVNDDSLWAIGLIFGFHFNQHD